jgi:hypothetical protein
MVITGDLKQSDRGVDNGLADIMRKIKFYNDFDIYKKDELGIRIVEMDSQDIQRSPIVAKLLDIYCGKPMVSHHAPSFSRDVSGGDSVDGGGDSVDGGGDSVDGGVADVRDWSVGVENVVHPKEINSENSIVKNDVFIDNISEHEPFEMEYKIPDNDAALIPLKYTKSKHFPKDFTL